MDIHSDTGVIGSGDYDTVVAETFCRLDDNVRFGTLLARGDLSASDITGGRLVSQAAHISCARDLLVHQVHGSGRLDVTGDIICDSLSFDGTVRCAGRIRCSGDLTVHGTLVNTHQVSADTMRVDGVVTAAEVRARLLRLHPLISGILSRFDMDEFDGGRIASKVIADEVDAQGLVCRALSAERATLVDGCHIDAVTCENELTSDDSSRLMLIGGNCRHTRRGIA